MSNPEIKVLDKGFVHLIDHMGTDLSVVNAARVSFGKKKDAFEEGDAKLWPIWPSMSTPRPSATRPSPCT